LYQYQTQCSFGEELWRNLKHESACSINQHKSWSIIKPGAA